MLEKTANQQDLEEELRGLKDLLNVAQVVVSSLELDEVLENILGSAMTIMGMPAGSIALYDQPGNKLQLHAHLGLSQQFVNHATWTVKAGGLTASILDQAELLVVEDTSLADCFNNPLVINEGIRSLIAVPLKIQAKVVGILYVDDFVPRSFSRIRLRLLSILGSFAAMSIDNARLHKKTCELASTDGLTGLFNYRHFKKVFAEELVRARRYEKPLAVIMLDIDDFKQFNDVYGHPVGDKVLVRVAEILGETLRDCDYVFRYGGEEFIAILPETELPAALTAAERLRQLIADDAHRYLDTQVRNRVTASIGVAVYPRDGQTLEDLLSAADALLYVAKREGKNKVYWVPAE